MNDLIESVKKLDVSSNSIIILRVAPDAEVEPLHMAVDKLTEWLAEHDLQGVQIFIVQGNDFDVNILNNDDMNKCGWYRKDDL